MVGGRNARDIASAVVTTPAAPLAPCPSPSTKPSRALSNGRDASAGRSLCAIDTTFIREKPKIMPGVTHASAPPDRTTSASPFLMSAVAYPIASVELVQPHDSTWLTPRRRNEIEISLDIIPTIEMGIAYGVTRRPCSTKKS